MLGFLQAVSSAFSKYGDFSGRSLQSEFWFFTLFCIIGDIATTVIDSTIYSIAYESTFVFVQNRGFAGIVFWLVVLIPSLSVTARRLHDVGRSGWWMLITFTIIGIIPYLYWMILEGDHETNKYGPQIRI